MSDSEKMNTEKKGLVSVIKYEGDNDTFIWKHPIEDFNYGSQLIVHESQEAIFFKDGQALDTFGPGRYTLETQSLPILNNVYKLATGSVSPFHAEVYFINKTVQMAIKWGTPDKVRFIDPLTGTPLDLGASGEMNLQVDNSRKLLVQLVGTMKGIAWGDREGFTKSIQESFRPLISNAVKTNLPTVIKSEAIDILEIDENLGLISDNLKEKIKPGFEEYGLTIPQFYVTSVVLPENDPNFKRIRELHTITLHTRILQAEATVKTAQAQSEAQYRTAQEQSKAAIEAAHREAELQKQLTETEVARREAERKIIAAQADAEAAKMAGMAEAEVMRAKGYNEKDVLNAEVQKAYAEGIGNMGPEVSNGGGSSIVGDMMGLGVGMAAANAIMPQIGNMMQGMNTQQQANNSSTSTAAPSDSWDCACGQKGVVGNFCNNCGSKRPVTLTGDSWDCSCGLKGIVGNFCNNCGKKRGE
ncbi:MAG: SPFH domain-containing protein [Clostridiales bacterium]|nr:SPFH domain-containing protein [Clostridiales bacterium]